MSEVVYEHDDQPRFYTLAELDAEHFETDYLIDGVLVAGQPAILAGPKKSMKTSISLDLAISLATGGRFLGRFQVTRPVKAGVLSGESGLPTILETARRICSAAGKTLADVGDNLVVSGNFLPRFDSPKDLDRLEGWIRDGGIKVVIVDPAFMAVPGDGAGNLFIMGSLLGKAAGICRRAGSTLIIVHHTRKQSGNGSFSPFAPIDLDDMAWSGFAEFARQWILLNRREAYEQGTGHHALWMSAGGSAGHSGLWAVDIDEGAFEPGKPRTWVAEVTTAAEQRQNTAEERRAKLNAKNTERIETGWAKVKDFLTENPGGATKSVIKERVLKDTALTTAVLGDAETRGRVVPCKVPAANHQAYPGFKLAV